MKLILGLIVALGFGYYTYTQEMAKQTSCDDEDVQARVTRIYDNLDSNPNGPEMYRKIDGYIEKGIIDGSKREEIVIANLEMIDRTTNSCDIPASLNNKVTQHISANPKGKTCPAGQFDAQVVARYEKNKTKPNFAEFEKNVFAQMFQQMSSESSRDRYKKQWEDPAFREATVKAVYNIEIRDKNNCKNIALPMSKVIQQMVPARSN